MTSPKHDDLRKPSILQYILQSDSSSPPPRPSRLTAEARQAREAKHMKWMERRRAATRLLYIEPNHPADAQPRIDSLTRRMTAAWRKQDSDNPFGVWKGFHRCKCEAQSSSQDHNVFGFMTNSLCIHYLTFHRAEVPQTEIAKVLSLPDEEQEPSFSEIEWPRNDRRGAFAAAQKLIESGAFGPVGDATATDAELLRSAQLVIEREGENAFRQTLDYTLALAHGGMSGRAANWWRITILVNELIEAKLG